MIRRTPSRPHYSKFDRYLVVCAGGRCRSFLTLFAAREFADKYGGRVEKRS